MIFDIKAPLLKLLKESADLSKFPNIEAARFEQDLNLDSLDTVELIIALEKELNFTIDEKYLVGVKTVGQLVTAVGQATTDKESLLPPNRTS